MRAARGGPQLLSREEQLDEKSAWALSDDLYMQAETKHAAEEHYYLS